MSAAAAPATAPSRTVRPSADIHVSDRTYRRVTPYLNARGLRVLGHVAADGRKIEARRIRRIEAPFAGEMILELLVDDAALDFDLVGRRVEAEHAVQLLRRYHERAVERYGSPEKPDRRAPARNDCDPRREASPTSLARSSRLPGNATPPARPRIPVAVEAVREQVAILGAHRHAAQRAGEIADLPFPVPRFMASSARRAPPLAGRSAVVEANATPPASALVLFHEILEPVQRAVDFVLRRREENRIILSQPNAPPGMTTSPCSRGACRRIRSCPSRSSSVELSRRRRDSRMRPPARDTRSTDALETPAEEILPLSRNSTRIISRSSAPFSTASSAAHCEMEFGTRGVRLEGTHAVRDVLLGEREAHPPPVIA